MARNSGIFILKSIYAKNINQLYVNQEEFITGRFMAMNMAKLVKVTERLSRQ